jgi:dephospho-CoA kinase
LVVIGLTGPIAGGKSSAARLLAERGAEVIELDTVGHELLAEPEVRVEVDAAFPEAASAADQDELRRRLGALVFADPERLARLERILHPRMCERVRERVEERRGSGRAGTLVICGALLYEMGLDEACDAVVCVDAPEELRADRARASRGWDRQELSRREARQLPAAVKAERADYRVVNDRELNDLAARLAAIWEELECP